MQASVEIGEPFRIYLASIEVNLQKTIEMIME
jgi:hypothetical protein